MRHLFASRCAVLRLAGDLVNGVPVMSWDKVTDIVDPLLGTPGELMCRLDLSFVRPGKDQPMPIVAGRAPDRTGVAFYNVTNAIKAGDRLLALAGPVSGTFEIRVIPDPALDSSTAHHMEVQVVEVAQSAARVFPGAVPDEGL